MSDGEVESGICCASRKETRIELRLTDKDKDARVYYGDAELP